MLAATPKIQNVKDVAVNDMPADATRAATCWPRVNVPSLTARAMHRGSDKISVHTIPGGDTKWLFELIDRLQAKLRGRGSVRLRTVCCYEALTKQLRG